MCSKARCSRAAIRSGSTHSSSTPTAARTSGPNNLTPPAPICCRRRTRSSPYLARAVELQLTEAEAARPKRTRSGKSRRRGFGSPGFRGRGESWICRQGSGCGLPSLRAGPPRRSQQCPRPVGFVDEVPLAGPIGHERRPQGRPEASGRIAVASPRPRPANAGAHNLKAWILHEQGRFEEAIAERERTLALDPADVNAMMAGLGSPRPRAI